jgi:hypothetical protein
LANLTDDVQIRCYGSNNATDAEFTYWSEVQLVDDDEIIMFPFVDGTHAADTIDETQTLPDKCTIVLKGIEPRFSYDTAESIRLFAWRNDATHVLRLNYVTASDVYRVSWIDGGTDRALNSQQFDDGSSFTDLNQRLDIYISLDLVSGGTNDSRFIVIPQESGSLNEDTSWSGTPDVKTSTFTTLSIGHESNTQQADSIYETFRILQQMHFWKTKK